MNMPDSVRDQVREALQDAEYDLCQWLACDVWLVKAGFNMDGTAEVVAKVRAALAALEGGE